MGVCACGVYVGVTTLRWGGSPAPKSVLPKIQILGIDTNRYTTKDDCEIGFVDGGGDHCSLTTITTILQLKSHKHHGYTHQPTPFIH